MAPRYPLQGDGVPRWVLTMDWRGRRLAWTSDGATVVNLDRYVVGSVEVDDVPDRIDVKGEDIREPLSVSLPWFEGEQPQDLQDRPCTLSLVPASGYANRYTVLSGPVVRTQLDRPGALVGIESAPEDFSGRTWPPSSLAVTPSTHPQTANDYVLSMFPAHMTPADISTYVSITNGPREDTYGTGYPVTFGASVARYISLGGFAVYNPTAPAPVIDDSGTPTNPKKADLVLVSAGVVDTSGLYLFSEYDDGRIDQIEVDPADVVAGVDYLGQSYTAVDVSNETANARKGEWYSTTITNTSPTASAGAGHIATWLLSKVGAVDLSWCGEAEARSVGLPLAGYIDEPVEPLAWCQDNVFGRLPIATTRAPSGLLRRSWVPFHGGPAVATLTDGERGVYRSGEVTEAGERTPRQFEIRYQYSVIIDKHYETLTLQNGRITPDMPRDVIELDNVHATSTAGVIALYALWRDRYRREVQIDAAVDTWGWLRPGQLVRYNDADLSIVDRLYIVQSIARTDRPFTSIILTPVDPDHL